MHAHSGFHQDFVPRPGNRVGLKMGFGISARRASVVRRAGSRTCMQQTCICRAKRTTQCERCRTAGLPLAPLSRWGIYLARFVITCLLDADRGYKFCDAAVMVGVEKRGGKCMEGSRDDNFVRAVVFPRTSYIPRTRSVNTRLRTEPELESREKRISNSTQPHFRTHAGARFRTHVRCMK
jgi:hypothetical protein